MGLTSSESLPVHHRADGGLNKKCSLGQCSRRCVAAGFDGWQRDARDEDVDVAQHLDTPICDREVENMRPKFAEAQALVPGRLAGQR